MRLAGFILSLLGACAAGVLGLSWLSSPTCQSASFDPRPVATVIGGHLLVLALALGCVASTFVLQGRGRPAALLLLGGGLVPGLVEPKAFVATFVLIGAGLLALGVGELRQPLRGGHS